jgi:PEP-CTERM motif
MPKATMTAAHLPDRKTRRSRDRSKITTLALTTFAASGLVLGSAPTIAAVITAGSTTTVGGFAIPPGSGADYRFYGNGAQPTNLTNFTQTALPPLQFDGAGSTYTFVQPPIGGVAFQTGIAYLPTSGTSDLATFTVSAGANQSFAIYVLYGNGDGIGAIPLDQSIGVSANGGAPVTTSVVDTAGTNLFLEFDVTGANAGDTFTFSATADPGNIPYIGGVSFGALTPTDVPEPATLALLSVGAGGLLFLRRPRNGTGAAP